MAATVADRGLRLQLLGPVAGRLGSRPLDLGHPKQRAVLAMLALHPDAPVSTDELLDGLWPNGPPAAGVPTLQAYVSNLRRALEPDRPRRGPSSVIRTTTGGYQLTVDPDAIDTVRFERAVTEAADVDDPRHAAALLADAIGSWSGPALADFRYEQFAQPHIARLEERLVDALELRVAADLELGRAAELVPELRRLTVDHPYRERLHGQLMVALYRAGRHAEALAAYDRLSSALRDELGLDPSPELRTLQLAILDHDVSLLTRAPARTAARVRRGARPPASGSTLVGRDGELASLRQAVERAVTGRGAIVIVEGEAGIGKTRLLEAFHDEAAGLDALAAFARCVEVGGSPPYWPWTQLVRRLGEGDLLAAAGSRATALAPLVADGDESLARPGPPLHRIADALVEALGELGRRNPIVLVIDDLYSADPDSLALLNLVASGIDQIPVVIAGSHRGVDLGADHPLTTTLAHLSRLDGVVRLPLPRLRPDDVRTIVRETVGGEIADEAIATIHARAGGNAFFTVELSKLLDTGTDVASAEAMVPATVREVIQQRTRALSAPAMSLLRTGAVCGREFEVAVALDVTGLSISAGADALDEIARLGLLTEGEQPASLRFVHVIVVDSLVQGLGALRRAQLHHRIAQILEARHGTDPAAWVTIAHHRCEALGVGTAADAIEALARAGRYALDADALGLAESLARQRLELVPSLRVGDDRDSAEIDALLELVRVLTTAEGYHSAGLAAAADRLEQLTGLDRGTAVLGTARPVTCHDPVLSTLQARFSYVMVTDTIPAARDVVDAWLEIADANPDAMAVLSANIARLVVDVHACDLAGADAAAAATRDALAVLDPHGINRVMLPLGQQSAAVTALGFAAWGEFLAGRTERSDAAFAEARSVCEQMRHPFTTGFLVSVETMTAAMAGSPTRVHETLAWGRRTIPDGLFWLLDEWHGLISAWAHGMTSDDPAIAARTVRAGLDVLHRRGVRVVSTLYWAMAAELELRAGHADAALDAAQRGLDDAVASGERFWAAELERLQAVALGRLGRHDESTRALARARLIATELGVRPLLDRLAGTRGTSTSSAAGL